MTTHLGTFLRFTERVHSFFLAGIRTPAKIYIFCLVSGKQRKPQKSKKAKRGANSGEVLSCFTLKETRQSCCRRQDKEEVERTKAVTGSVPIQSQHVNAEVHVQGVSKPSNMKQRARVGGHSEQASAKEQEKEQKQRKKRCPCR